MWTRNPSRKTKIRNEEIKKILSSQFLQYKVFSCKHCGRWGVTESELRFKCFGCDKTMAIKKVNEPGLAIKMYGSYIDARVAGEVVRQLNVKRFTRK